MKKNHILIVVIVSLNLFGCVPKTQTNLSFTPTKDVTANDPIANLPSTLTVEETELPMATMNAAQSAFVIKQLLLQNDYCDTPCAFGIAPGNTTLKEAQATFVNLGSPLIRTTQLSNLDFYEALFGPKNGLEDGLSFQIILTIEDQDIKNMRASISLINYEDTSVHSQWKAYSPESVLNRYGVPSKVSFSLSYPAELGSSPNAVWYDMIVYFDSINLILEYSSHPINSLSKEGNTVDVCPITDQFEGVNIWLGKEPINPPVLGFPLENVSPFSVKEFYDVIVINNGCFSLDASKFSR